MASPTQRRRSSSELRRLLLQAAVEVFKRRGFSKATTDEIAETAGVSMSVLFRNFGTKGELFREALVEPFVGALRSFTKVWDDPEQRPATEEAVMQRFISDVYDNLHRNEAAVAGLISARDALDDETVSELDRVFAQIFEQMRVIGEEEASLSEWVSESDMELTARLAVSLVTAVVVYRDWYLPRGRNRLSRERLLNHICKLMLYGLRLAPQDVPPR